MFTDEDRQRDINTNGRVAVVYPISAGVARLEAAVGVLVKLAGEDAERDTAEAARAAERHAEEMRLDAERHAEAMAKLAAVQAGDPQVLADLLGEYLTEDFLDALAQIRLTRAGA